METRICIKCNQEKNINKFRYRKDRKIYRRDCLACECQRNKTWVKTHKEKAYAIIRKYEHTTKGRTKHAKRNKLRYHTDIVFRIKSLLRSRIYAILKGGAKSERTEKLLGHSYEFCKSHLESKFQPGMTWDEPGKFHIDHIRPCSSFDLTDPKQLAECCHYTNLQPLWAHDNLSKGAKYTPPPNETTEPLISIPTDNKHQPSHSPPQSPAQNSRPMT